VRAEFGTDPDADTQPIPVIRAPAGRDATLLWLGAGAAVGIGALLVFGGGVGSGGVPREDRSAAATAGTAVTLRPASSAPAQPAQTLRPAAAPARPIVDLRLGARAGKSVWVEVRRGNASGESLFAGVVGNGVTKRFTSRRPLWLGVAWAPNARVVLNGGEIDADGGTESYLVTATGLTRIISP
jgi:hypothetical protein